MNKWNLRFISLIAYGLLGMGIWCNMIFYSTFGGGSSVIYAMIGLLLDLAKIAFVGLIVHFLRDVEQYLAETAFCVMLWLLLSLLSLAAAYGFLSQINERYEAERLKASAIYAQHKAAVDNAQAKLDELAQYALPDTAAITAQIGSLTKANQTLLNSPANNSIGQRTGRSVGQMTSQCTENNWYTGHYCGKVTDNNTSIQQLQARLDGHDQYQSALAHHQQAQQTFGGLTVSGAANQAHSLFINIGLLTDNQAAGVKRWFILLTSLVFEILTSALMFMRYKVIFGSSPASYRVEEATQPAGLSMASHDFPSPLLEQVKNDMTSGRLKSLSFRTLQRTYRVGPSTAEFIRQSLLKAGFARMNENTHQITINNI